MPTLTARGQPEQHLKSAAAAVRTGQNDPTSNAKPADNQLDAHDLDHSYHYTAEQHGSC
jgi:hypothetical protein